MTEAQKKLITRAVTAVVTKLGMDKPQIEFFVTIVERANLRCGGEPELLGFQLYRSLLLAETIAYIDTMRAFMTDELAGRLAKASWGFTEAYAHKALA